MKLQLGNNIKIFVTTNLDANNNINLSTLTKSNTFQLIIQKDSLSIEQTKNLEYLENNEAIDNTVKLPSLSKPSLQLGSLGFTTLLNSSKTGPFDVLLWNSLVSQDSYPNYKWDLESAYYNMNLIRDTVSVRPLGFIIVTDNLVYILNSARVNNLNINLDTNSLVTCSWSLNYETATLLNQTNVLELTDGYQFSGEIIGQASKVNLNLYKWANSKMLLINVYEGQSTIKLGSLAATSLNLSLSNSLNYLEDNAIDRTSLSYMHVDAGSYNVQGSISFYTRSPGVFTNTFINNLISNATDALTTSTYRYTIELPITKTKNLCEISLPYCASTITTSFSSVLTNTVSIKLLDTVQPDYCFIKFYT